MAVSLAQPSGCRYWDCFPMYQRTSVRPGNQRRTDEPAQPRPIVDDDEAEAWRDDSEPAGQIVAIWKRAVLQAEGDLLRLGCWFAVLDVATALSGCFLTLLGPALGLARLVALAILVPAFLRTLAMQHARRPDADLLKAIAIAVGVAAVYLAVRTRVVVSMCSL